MRRNLIFLATLFILATALLSAGSSDSRKSPAAVPATSRKFTFSYQVHVPASQSAQGRLLVWVPLPQDDGYQKIDDLRIETPVRFDKGQDSEYGDPYVLLRPTAEQQASGFDLALHFVVTRMEHKVALISVSVPGTPDPATDPRFRRYLQPDKLVPLNGVIAQLAQEQTAGDSNDLAKARHIYNYVVSSMRYDKSGEGWGRGDAIWACTAKRGNCTDFHSLFIGMMRAAGIPARFEIGFPVPDGKVSGDIPGYHCWAEFYVRGAGWIPVDASEASKNPQRRDYFFGAHDANRVFFTYGRDLRLSSEQKGEPINYFIYPYAELNGQPFTGLQTHFAFSDIAVSFAAEGK